MRQMVDIHELVKVTLLIQGRDKYSAETIAQEIAREIKKRPRPFFAQEHHAILDEVVRLIEFYSTDGTYLLECAA